MKTSSSLVCRSICTSLFTQGQILYFVQGLHLLLSLMRDLTAIIILVLMTCQHFPFLNYHTSINRSGLSLQLLLISFLCLADCWKRVWTLSPLLAFSPVKVTPVKAFILIIPLILKTNKQTNKKTKVLHVSTSDRSLFKPSLYKIICILLFKSFLVDWSTGWFPFLLCKCS